MKQFYTPNDFAGLATDSKMIQAAVDEAAKYGVRVVIPKYNERRGECRWELDEGIKLYTGSYVTLDSCYIRLADDTVIHFFENSVADSLDDWYNPAHRQYDITLKGEGNVILDGGNHNGVFESCFNIYDENGKFIKKTEFRGFKGAYVNRGLQFRNVERITVQGFRMINCRYWGMNFEFCSEGHVSDIQFESLNHVPNQDGIDVRVGCHNFLLENISGKTGDDTIALTNFGLPEAEEAFPELDVDIHDIMIRNIRSYVTVRCDMIRLLNRGGAKIYNIQISGVVDVTPEGEEHRPLAGIRIGDLNNYPARLNLPGETRNITVRDVISRARFGVYVANSLTDSVFDNIMMTSEGGIGMYFNGCETKNVFIDKLTYNSVSEMPKSDIGYSHVHHKVNIDTLAAVYFNNSTAENVNIRNLVGGKNLDCLVGSNRDIDLSIENATSVEKLEKPFTDTVKIKA